ncbi:MAG: FAD-dependent oxidoreductase [Oscillospiraceae bacterium]|jgi:glycine/D-amino acid oxidase-like deaminating enzyme/nitrite reductase/ring-hydroxylating ferredoxin subunit
MESIWKQAGGQRARDPLQHDIETEAAVIGAGLAGCLTAYFLQRRGVETVVLEADRIGSGQTGHTTAKITVQHGLRYETLIQKLGMERARQYAAANQQAIQYYREIIRTQDIACALTEMPAYLYTTSQPDLLKREEQAARRLGIDAVFTTETALPFPVAGALRMDHQAQFHPLQFLNAIAAKLEIYEQTRAHTVHGNQIQTDRGTVTAKHIVFATHFPFLTVRGLYPLRMYQERSYVLALEQAAQPDGMYLGIDPDGLSLRPYDRFLLLGGKSHRSGKNPCGGAYAMLRQQAVQNWPGCREVAHWSAQDCMPLDGVPYIGQLCATTPNWYVATGFQKWGMTSAMVAAMRLCDLICDTHLIDHDVFSPQRITISASAKNLGTNSLEAVKGIGMTCLSIPKQSLEQLPPGHGGIVRWQGKKVGVYKDKGGKIFPVHVRCPHLGCQLAWNPDELSWDCPCHGSRFDIHGKLLDNPAQEDLTIEQSSHH